MRRILVILTVVAMLIPLLQGIMGADPYAGEGDVTIPIAIQSSSASAKNNQQNLSNDRISIDGIDQATICYVDYKNYIFSVNITDKKGTDNVNNVTLTLDPYGEPIELRWFQSNSTFMKLSGAEDLLSLDVPNCTNTTIGSDRWCLNFSIRFKWTHLSEDLKLCSLNTTNDTGASVFDEFENVYRVENDLELAGNLQVTGQYQGALSDGDWVRGNEKITWTNLKVVYEGTTNVYPDDKNFNVTITDDESNTWVNTSSSGKVFKITTVSDPYTDNYNLHDINITDIPGFGQDNSKWTFMIKTDDDAPTAPSKVVCHADSKSDSQTSIDDDTTIYVTWDDSIDGTGSGNIQYAMEYNNNLPTIIRNNGDSVTGAEGLSTFYVRARDKVGNWGPVDSASIMIDDTDVTFINPVPVSDSWHNSTTVECGITIRDLGGSGVRSDSIYYRHVEHGSINSGNWKRYLGAVSNQESITCKQNITFKNDGVYKKVQWRASDVAGNYLDDPNYYSIKIDSTPVSFESFSFDFEKWHMTLSPEISFLVNDTKPPNDECSGVDVNTIMYQTSTDGPANYGPWLPIVPLGTGESVKCTLQPTFAEGLQNFIRFKGHDLVGNKITTGNYRIKIDTSTPEFINPVPDSKIWMNSTHFQCNITLIDEYSEVDVHSVRYSFSYNGTDNYNRWNRIKITHLNESHYKRITLTSNITFKEGENNYIRWLATDTAGNEVISDDFRIKVDDTGCAFNNSDPVPNAWTNSKSLLCSIEITDLGGSGIDIDTIQYSYSTAGLDNFGKWKATGILKLPQNYSTAEENNDISENGIIYSLLAKVAIKNFNEGTDNYIYWRVKDLAGNGYTYGGPFQIQIDLSPLQFFNPKPNPTTPQIDLEQICKITIKDNESGSGVEPNSVEYRYSISGTDGYNKWSKERVSQIKLSDGYTFIIYINFKPGSRNYIQWRASDVAGNGPFMSGDNNVLINTAPTPKISSPRHNNKKEYDYTTIDDIIFDAQKSFDPDENDQLKFYWESNSTGPLGYKEYFNGSLPSGKHQITLYVSDGNYHNVSTNVNITVVSYRDIKDTDGDDIPDYLDPDIDNDHRLNEDDAFPTDKREWLDTDLDGIGNNKDLDDDGDEFPDNADYYPLDNKRWKKEAEEEPWTNIIIAVVIIVIIVLILTFVIVGVKRKSAAEEKTKGDKLPGEPESTATATTTTTKATITPTTPITPVPAVQPNTGESLGETSMPYQHPMPIPPPHPYQPLGLGLSPAQQIPQPLLPPYSSLPSTMPPVQHPIPVHQPLYKPGIPFPQQPKVLNVFKCENCGASILNQNRCQYCGWSRF